MQQLLKKYLDNRCSPAEAERLIGYFREAGPEDERLSALMRQQLEEPLAPDRENDPAFQARLQQGLDHILGNIRKQKKAVIFKWYHAAAAAAILAIAFGAWLAIDYRQSAVSTEMAEVLPGGNRATLTLADGRVIDLDEARTGIVVGTGTITYDDGSALDALSSEAEGRRDISLLELTTPKGGTYRVTLPDGSKVWLNSASTLKYPSRFSENSREVILEGEAFFEIKAIQGVPKAFGTPTPGEGSSLTTTDGARVPFKVQTAGQVVQVLGTQFNISAYPDEAETKTTLVEGKVRVEAQGASLQLVPGEQGVAGDGLTKTTVDVTQYTAWRDGRFSFVGKPFVQVMRELARWYDLEVEYLGGIPDETFFGGAFRDSKLSIVLALLESARIDYRLDAEARKLTIINRKGGGM